MGHSADLPSVLFVVPSLIGGGAERNIVWLSNRWVALGARATVVTVSGDAGDAYTLDSRVKRISLDLAGERTSVLGALRGNLQRVWALRREILAARNAAAQSGSRLVVVSFIVSANITSCLAVLGLSVPLIVSERNHPPLMNLGGVWRRMRGPAYRRANAVVALTQRSADWLRHNTGARELHVIPNPVVLPLPIVAPAIEPDAILAPELPLVLAAGKLQQQKGFDLLLDAWATLSTDWHLVIAGPGDPASLQAQIQTLGIGDRVHVIGRAGNLAHWYERADLFVLSSRYEGFPNVLVEAMASGLPVLSADCETGPADLINNDVNGILVEPNSSQALAEGLQRLLPDAILRQRLAQQAIEVREQLDADRLFAIWQSLITQQAGTAERTVAMAEQSLERNPEASGYTSDVANVKDH